MKRDVKRFVDSLLRQRRPRSFKADDEDAATLRAAIDLSAAQPGADQPSAQFVSDLRDRLERTSGDPQQARQAPVAGRRRVLRVAAVATSAFAVGFVADRVIGTGDEPSTVADGDNTITPTTGTWATVVPSAELTEGAVREFDLGTVVGVVQRTSGRLRAVSSICTHQACRLGLNDVRDTLVCPCHGATFSVAGQPIRNLRSVAPLPALPRLAVREFEGAVQIYCPARI